VARGRNIKPSFFTDDELCECDPLARLLFAGLWCHADRSGRMEYRSKTLKVHVLPYDNCCIDTLIVQLSDKKFIQVYECENEYGEVRKYIQIKNFAKHQHPHVKEPASTIPAPDAPGAKTPLTLNLKPLTLNPITETRIPGPVRCADKYSPDFETFWGVFPQLRRTAKGRAWKAWKVAIRKESPENIIAAAAEYAASETGRGQFVVMPATWLNGDCWTDDRAAWSPTLARRASVVPTDADNANWNSGG
jgi:hypothetical protein